MYVNVRFKAIWQFKDFPHYKVTKDKKIINAKTETLLTYNQRGFYIMGKYLKRNQLNPYLEKIKKPKTEYCPFSNGTIKI
tara:strand:- start:560 stop:799 length:240 start_codon:yes stop_codon:yes gene_type:complete